MWNWLRRAIAEKLCPEVFREHRLYKKEFHRIADAYWWMGDFPEAAATLQWITHNHQDWSLKIDEPAIKRAHYWRQGVGDFREQLRRGEHLRVFGKSE